MRYQVAHPIDVLPSSIHTGQPGFQQFTPLLLSCLQSPNDIRQACLVLHRDEGHTIGAIGLLNPAGESFCSLVTAGVSKHLGAS